MGVTVEDNGNVTPGGREAGSPGARGRVVSALLAAVEDSVLLVWGGLCERGEALGNSWIPWLS